MESTNEALIAEARRCDRIGPTPGEASLLIARLANALEAAIRADREPEPATDAWAEGFEAGAGRKPRFGEVKNRRRYDDEPEPVTEATEDRCPSCGSARWTGWAPAPGWPGKRQCVPCGKVRPHPPAPATEEGNTP